MNLDRIEAVLKLLQRQGHVTEISAEGDDWRLRVRRGPVLPVIPLEDDVPGDEEPSGPERQTVRANWVGIYRAPDHPLHSGEYIRGGGSVGDIDSMRILNPVTVEEGGYLERALVEDGDPVEYGQELFVLAAEPPPVEGR